MDVYTTGAEQTTERKSKEKGETEIKADKEGNVTYCSVGFKAAEMGWH